MWNRKKVLAGIVLLLAAYVASYMSLSRRGYAEADQYGMKGFDYIFHERTDAWSFTNYGCVVLFWPLNAVDRALGYGRYPAREPLWELSK